jgi:hypothetical protein
LKFVRVNALAYSNSEGEIRVELLKTLNSKWK